MIKLIPAGFIFPDGTMLNSAGIGHPKVAMEYIRSRPKIKEMFQKETEFRDEKDFLTYRLGACMLCHSNGVAYAFIPQIRGTFMNYVLEACEMEGRKIIFFTSCFTEPENNSIDQRYLNNYGFTRTIVPIVFKTADGKIHNNGYMYNPNRYGE